MIENQIKTIRTYTDFFEEVKLGEGNDVDKLYDIVGMGSEKPIFYIDFLPSYTQAKFTIANTDVFIRAYIPLKLYLDGKDITKGETLSIAIKNGEFKVMEIIQEKYEILE